MVYLGAVLGLRWGEVAGLRVGRLDQQRGTVAVAEQIVRGEKGQSMAGPPKSVASRRTLTMPKALVELLAEHLRRRGGCYRCRCLRTRLRGARRRSIGVHKLAPSGLASGVRDCWTARNRIPRSSTGLCHRIVAGGVNVETAQDRLGHSDPRLTLDLYAQVTTAADREAADVVGEYFLPSFALAARTRAKSPHG
jgi:integrase